MELGIVPVVFSLPTVQRVGKDCVFPLQQAYWASLIEKIKTTCSLCFPASQGVDESGADRFTVLFPSGTPLPARRQHMLQAPGGMSSVCLELYESEGKNSTNEEAKFAQVNTENWTLQLGCHETITILCLYCFSVALGSS